MTPSDIIDQSCRSFGSSYLGRHEGTKHLTGINYKAPIIIEETQSMIFSQLLHQGFQNVHGLH